METLKPEALRTLGAALWAALQVQSHGLMTKRVNAPSFATHGGKCLFKFRLWILRNLTFPVGLYAAGQAKSKRTYAFFRLISFAIALTKVSSRIAYRLAAYHDS